MAAITGGEAFGLQAAVKTHSQLFYLPVTLERAGIALPRDLRQDTVDGF